MTEYHKIITQNKKALFEYTIEERIIAGIILVGSEVKALRQNKVSIVDSYAGITGKEILLYNSYIGEYDKANQFNHNTRRNRILLLKGQEIRKLVGKLKTKGYTLVALSMFFNPKNIVKVELGLAKGKKIHDKRQNIKEKDWKREQSRLLKTTSRY